MEALGPVDDSGMAHRAIVEQGRADAVVAHSFRRLDRVVVGAVEAPRLDLLAPNVGCGEADVQRHLGLVLELVPASTRLSTRLMQPPSTRLMQPSSTRLIQSSSTPSHTAERQSTVCVRFCSVGMRVPSS